MWGKRLTCGLPIPKRQGRTLAFPQSISFTITNTCNLRCQMCGQWSQEGYIRAQAGRRPPEMQLDDWKRVVDELAQHGIGSLLIRGGEPFLYPHIAELLEYIHAKGMFISIDTNGTQLSRYAALITQLGKIHLTISVDGPEEIHDQVRGVPGTFRRLSEGVAALHALEKEGGQKISLSINFTISPYSYRGLGVMPEVARQLGIPTACIVPYYYVPAAMGEAYGAELQAQFGCRAFSWRGFHHEDSGIDFDVFKAEYQKYRAALGEVYSYPYMDLSEEDYRRWFASPDAPVGAIACTNVEKLIDVQPGGDANFCVDYPDYTFGNVREATLEELWNSERAVRFRNYRRQKPLPVCYRCGGKYMSEIAG